MSLDNATYSLVGKVTSPARQGVTTSALTNLSGVDATSTLAVNMSMSGGELLPATQAEADSGVTLCYVDGELIAYQNATLTGVSAYNLSYLVRGLHGTSAAAHATGKQFARIDDSVFKYPFNADWVGKTVYLKFVSFNRYGSGAQGLADVTAVPYTIKGAPLPPVQNLALAKTWTGAEVQIKWDLLDQASRYEVQVYSGSTLVRTSSTVTEGQYTYSLDMLKQDGVTGRNLVFKVRPVSITGNTGAWSQVVATNAQVGALQGIQVTSGVAQAFFEYAKPADSDFAGVCIWVDTTANFAPTDANKVFDGNDAVITLSKLGTGAPLVGGQTYYLRAAGYDTFGKDALAISASTAFSIYSVTSQIAELQQSQLNTALRTEIEKISGQTAAIQNEAMARANADSAQASQITTLQTQTNSNTASIQTQANSINGLSAQYTVKTDVNGYVAGYGLATTSNNGTPTSAFIVNADKFGVGAAGKGTAMPFMVDTVNNKVGINGDAVVQGTLAASKLILSDSSNIYPDYDMLDAGFYNTTGTIRFYGTESAILGQKFASLIGADGARAESAWFPVESSVEYYIELVAWLAEVNAGNSVTAGIEFASIDAVGAATVTRSLPIKTNSAAFSSVTSLGSLSVKTATGERRARLYWTKTGATADARVGAFKVRRKVNDLLIVDGGVKTKNLDAKAVTAGKIDVTNLSAISADLGNITAGNVNLTSAGGSNSIRSNSKSWADTANGWIFAQNADGGNCADIRAGGNRIWMSSWNDCGIEFPGIRMTNGGLTINQLNVIDTANVVDGAVSKGMSASSAGGGCSIGFNAKKDAVAFISTIFSTYNGARLTLDGATIRQQGFGAQGAPITYGFDRVINVRAGNHSVSINDVAASELFLILFYK